MPVPVGHLVGRWCWAAQHSSPSACPPAGTTPSPSPFFNSSNSPLLNFSTPRCRHGQVPEALGAAGALLRDGSHPRAPTTMPPELEKALLSCSFPAYDRKVRFEGAHKTDCASRGDTGESIS
jgi:hypothetical protein